jgi:hypothetical protein
VFQDARGLDVKMFSRGDHDLLTRSRTRHPIEALSRESTVLCRGSPPSRASPVSYRMGVAGMRNLNHLKR